MIDFEDITAGNARDILASVPDALGLALGAHAAKNPHPFAPLTAEAPLRAAAYAAGQILAPRQSGEAQAAVIGRGLRTLDFGNALAAGLQQAARRRFDVQAQHLTAVAQVEVDRLGEPEPVGALDSGAPFGDVGDGLEYTVTRATLRDGEPLVLSSLGRILQLSRESIFNDDLGLIEDAVSATGVAAARLEARLVAAALETTGNLSDGDAVFDTAHGNVYASGGVLSSATVAGAMTKLRTQPAADGEALDAAAAYLFVAPVAELAARQLVFTLGLSVAVLVLTGLAGDRFYLVANSEVARSIAVARLSGAVHPLAVEAVRVPIEFDGAMVRVRIDTGAAMVGRRGIVRASS